MGIGDDLAPEVDARLGIQSVEVAAAILGVMSDAPGPAPLKDLARASGFSPAKVHRYLISLVRAGLVVQEASGFYGVGPKAVALGMAGLRALSPVRLAPQFLRDLRDATGETALLAIWSDRGPVVIDLEDSGRPIFMNIRPGSVLPVQRSATGRVFAAHLPSASKIVVDGKPTTISDEFGNDWSRVRDDVQASGVAVVHGTIVPGASAMSAPVFDHRGHIAAVIGIIARPDDLTEKLDHVVARLRAVAADFSRRLGGM